VLGLIGRASPITDAAGHAPPDGVSLELSSAYVATSPLSRLLDALTLLSTPQAIAVFVTLACLALAWTISGSGRWARSVLVLVACVAIIEAAAAFAPRPMARLRVPDPNVVTVDFHSHSARSHDVRKSYGVGNNRKWHRSGGFDIAYLTDHAKFASHIKDGNPRLAGDGTSLLTGVEGRYHRIMSTIMLGLDARDTALLNRRGNLLRGRPAAGRPPVTIIALPNRHLDSVAVASTDSLSDVAGIELIDAAPRGLGQFDREEPRIRRIASELRLTMVAASNNHGYGRAVAAWNLLTIPGWRELDPDSVGKLVEQSLRDRKPGALTIVQRTRPRTHDRSLPVTLPVLLFQLFGSLSKSERAVWLIWIWGIALLATPIRRRVQSFMPQRRAVLRAAGDEGNNPNARRA
jgi:hypothetical protein